MCQLGVDARVVSCQMPTNDQTLPLSKAVCLLPRLLVATGASPCYADGSLEGKASRHATVVLDGTILLVSTSWDEQGLSAELGVDARATLLYAVLSNSNCLPLQSAVLSVLEPAAMCLKLGVDAR